MKLKYIFASLVATLVLAGCEKEVEKHYLAELQVSTSYVSIPMSGGSASVTITASESWAFKPIFQEKGVDGIFITPSWLTASVTSGSAGETTVNFSAPTTLNGRTAELQITCGNKTQFINVIQGVAVVSNATCAEVIAGPDSKTFRVTGICTGIYNTTYGNWYLTDDTGTITIYGTLDSKGNTKNFTSWGLEVGDEVTVEGPKTTYGTTVELVDVTVIKINKSLVKVEETSLENNTFPKEGGEMVVSLSNKGNGLTVDIPEADREWLSISALAGNKVTFRAAPNEGGDRTTTVVFSTSQSGKTSSCQMDVAQIGAILDITAGDFNALEDGTAQYKIKAVISSIVMDKNDATKYNKYGNFYINDETGSVYVYGLLPEAGGASGQDVLTKMGAKVGDVITVVGPKGSYKGSPQMVNAYAVEHTPVTTVSCEAFNALEDGSDLFLVSGTVTKIVMDKNDASKYNKYGNFYINDGTAEVYVYGLVPTLSGASGQDLLTKLGVKEGDLITVVGPKSSYKGSPQMVNGYYVKHVPADE